MERLAGDASYFGKIVKKPYIGDERRKIEVEDIRRAGVLMFATQVWVLIACLILMLAVYLVMV